MKVKNTGFGLDFFKMLYQCAIRRNDGGFKKLVLQGYENPAFLELKHYGKEYRGKVIYNINAYGSSVGFFAEFIFLLLKLYYADDHGFIPYVSFGEDFLYYQEGEGEANAFLYFFEPVSEVMGIENAAYVLDAKKYHIQAAQDQLNGHGYAISDRYMNELSRMVKKYIRYNERTQKYLEDAYDDFVGNKKALAVHFRGTDYRRQYNDHPVFVTIEQEIKKVQEIFQKGKYEIIFLATDEQDAVEIFKREFGEKVKFFEDTWRAEGGNKSVAYSASDRNKHHYLLALEVLRDQYMLTRCTGLVCGISNLTLAARMMRKAWYDNDYEDLVIIDNDLCHNDQNFCDDKYWCE